jgi:uncharacterized protein YndB with AHSA1/START domain
MTTDTDTFVYHRDYGISPEQMWHILTDPGMRESWGAPGEGAKLDTVTSDLRVGGTEHHRCGPADQPEFEVATRWYHLAAPETAVFTEQIEAGGVTLGAGFVTYKISSTDGRTQLWVTVAVSSFVGPEMIAEFREGWDNGIDKLSHLAETMAA